MRNRWRRREDKEHTLIEDTWGEDRGAGVEHSNIDKEEVKEQPSTALSGGEEDTPRSPLTGSYVRGPLLEEGAAI